MMEIIAKKGVRNQEEEQILSSLFCPAGSAGVWHFLSDPHNVRRSLCLYQLEYLCVRYQIQRTGQFQADVYRLIHSQDILAGSVKYPLLCVYDVNTG